MNRAPRGITLCAQGQGTETQGADDDDVFVFLIVGGLFGRKGIAILEEAYLKAFSAFDRVVLVAKKHGAKRCISRLERGGAISDAGGR